MPGTQCYDTEGDEPSMDAVETCLPGAAQESLESERLAVRRVETPPDARSCHPPLRAVDVVVIEPEAPAYRFPVG
jgi:hypothetical protein